MIIIIKFVIKWEIEALTQTKVMMEQLLLIEIALLMIM